MSAENRDDFRVVGGNGAEPPNGVPILIRESMFREKESR